MKENKSGKEEQLSNSNKTFSVLSSPEEVLFNLFSIAD